MNIFFLQNANLPTKYKISQIIPKQNYEKVAPKCVKFNLFCK